MTALEEMQSRYREAHGRLWGGAEPPANANLKAVPVKQVWPPPAKPVLPLVVRPRDWVFVGSSEFVGWRDIVADVARRHRVTVNDIISHRRPKAIVRARQEACFLLREKTTLSLPKIGQRLGGRDHTTIIYSIRKHEARLAGEVYRKGVRNSPKNATKRPEMIGWPLSSKAVDK